MWKTAYGEHEVEYVACPLCGSEEFGHTVVEWSLLIVRCSECGMEYVRRRVRNPDWNYRSRESDIVAKYRPFMEGSLLHPRERNYQEMLDRLEAFRATGRLLDVGAHVGFFLRAAQSRGWSVVGVEPSPSLATLARESMGLDVRPGYLPDVGIHEEFDVVTFLDVLEHVPAPVETLAAARRVLRMGGVVLAKVPHVRWNRLKFATIKKLLGFRMDAFDSREHVLQFRADSLRAAFRRARLEPVELFIPRPVQTGGPVRRAFRAGAWRIGQLITRVANEPAALCPDLCLIGERRS